MSDERKYMRMYRQQGMPEEIDEATWLRMADGNVHNVAVAIEHGFDTPAAHYWTTTAAKETK